MHTIEPDVLVDAPRELVDAFGGVDVVARRPRMGGVYTDADARARDGFKDRPQLFERSATQVARTSRIFEQQYRPRLSLRDKLRDRLAHAFEALGARLRAIAPQVRIDVLDAASRGDVEIVRDDRGAVGVEYPVVGGEVDEIGRMNDGRRDGVLCAQRPKALPRGRVIRRAPPAARIAREDLDAVTAGGHRLRGEPFDRGFFFEPTIITDVPEDARVWREETFGPLLPIARVKDLDEALARANDSEFGLGSSIFTRDLKRTQQGIDRLDAGYTWVNTIQVAYDELPFGGTKHSGFGKEHGVEVLDFYTEQKSVVVAGV